MSNDTDSEHDDSGDSEAATWLERYGVDRRSMLKALGVGAAASGLSRTAAAKRPSTYAHERGKGRDHERGRGRKIDPQFGRAVTNAKKAARKFDPDHEVELHVEEPSKKPLHPSLFHFDPVGLCVDPGDVVQFTFTTPDHTITAYHERHGYQRRVPKGVPPFSSPIVNVGGAWLYRFERPGLYDYFCGPHHILGMSGRIFVGDPDEVGVPDYEDTFEGRGASGKKPPLLAPFDRDFLESELNAFSSENDDCEWPWLTPREVLDADALNPKRMCDDGGEATLEDVLCDVDRIDADLDHD